MTDYDDQEPPVSEGSVAAGFGLVFVLHLVFQFGAFLARLAFSGPWHPDDGFLPLAFLPLFGIGLSQLVYLVPTFVRLRRQGKTRTANGVLIAAAIAFLLNLGCSGLVIG